MILSSRQDPPAPKELRPTVVLTRGPTMVQLQFVGGPNDRQVITINGNQAHMIGDLLETVLRGVEVWVA